jgi:hypothetical protein
MAVGDTKRASEYDKLMGEGKFNMGADVFKYVFITESYTAIDANASAIGISNYTKVPSSGNYVQDTALTGVTWTRVGQITTFDFDGFSFGADGANPTTAKTAVVYNDTSLGKEVYAYVDMTIDGGTTPADTTLGLTYNVSASGAGTITTG